MFFQRLRNALKNLPLISQIYTKLVVPAESLMLFIRTMRIAKAFSKRKFYRKAHKVFKKNIKQYKKLT